MDGLGLPAVRRWPWPFVSWPWPYRVLRKMVEFISYNRMLFKCFVEIISYNLIFILQYANSSS